MVESHPVTGLIIILPTPEHLISLNLLHGLPDSTTGHDQHNSQIVLYHVRIKKLG